MKKLLVLAALLPMLWSCGTDDDADEPQPVTPPAQESGDADTEYPEIIAVDYRPAPGQFVNKLPLWEEGMDAAAMNTRAMQALNERSLVTLGAFGGELTMQLATPVTNRSGADFMVLGNAITNGAEPGIVYVSADGNAWYALKGEAWELSIPSYEVTFHQPAADATDAEYIRWTSATDGSDGWISRNATFHKQPFFPQWLAPGVDITLTARRLPDNAVLSTAGIWELAPLKGYADSYPNNADEAWLDIADAVDADGNPVALQSVSYIRVVNAMMQCCGVIGETSTEVAGIRLKP